jgi:hypothetical protein
VPVTHQKFPAEFLKDIIISELILNAIRLIKDEDEINLYIEV